MPGYKEFMHAGLVRFTPDQLDMTHDFLAEKPCMDELKQSEVENKSSVSDLQKELQRLEERKELASFQSRLYYLIDRNRTDYAESPGYYRHDRSKSIRQRDKEKTKRRKKNKDKKTHRK